MGTIPALPSFTSGQELTASELNQLVSWASFWQSPPRCRVVNTVGPNITGSSNWNLLGFDSEDYDTDGMHSTSTNTSRITVQTSGYYMVASQVRTNNSGISGTGRQSSVCKNTGGTFNVSNEVAHDARTNASGGDIVLATPVAIVQMTAGDYFELFAWQNEGSSVPTIASGIWMQVQLVGKI